LSGALLAVSAQAQNSSCNAEGQRLQAQVQQLQSDAASGSAGICESARGQARILRAAASYNRRCGGADGAAQARQLESQAAQADETAAASCSR
ncbi:MAG: hypothetical protein JSR47_23460, partial [Proteobacteria bacterium]|nr:hypothetical protein [Pseudomonadota bacterium]